MTNDVGNFRQRGWRSTWICSNNRGVLSSKANLRGRDPPSFNIIGRLFLSTALKEQLEGPCIWLTGSSQVIGRL
jgi:hypothetical protein